ncbi:MAG TPA: class I SAM-dependent methyltransferase [Ferruginibacter sp.]|jgi:SAM-dependent methyltransferase|nr:class I SAM-dependent methyltransferase [Ferruginibacter sp.]
MSANTNHIENAIKEKNISFYNAIADGYDTVLEKQQFNKIVRRIVEGKFLEVVKNGNVLDFGGGTGLDLHWLTDNNYKVFFCEPSTGMRKNAVAYKETSLKDKDIIFLNNNATDYTTWKDAPPVAEKIDAVLSNFAVINCIPDINSLFENLALVMNQGGNMIALVLDGRNKLYRSGLRKNIRSFILQQPITMFVKDKDKEQTVFVYSLKKIKKAADPYFEFCSSERLAEYGFCLIHLIKR